jgi:hypothetical protein
MATAAAGRPTEARDIATRAIEAATRHCEKGFLASSLRSLAAIEITLKDLRAAKDHLDDALAAAARCEMRPLVAGCHLDLALLHHRAGNEQDAHRALARGQEMLRDLGLAAPPRVALEA